MAEIWREDGFIFRIWSNDHRPPHVHVFKGEKEAVFYIGDEDTPPSLHEHKSKKKMTLKEAKKVLVIIAEHQELFLEKWDEIHGSH